MGEDQGGIGEPIPTGAVGGVAGGLAVAAVTARVEEEPATASRSEPITPGAGGQAEDAVPVRVEEPAVRSEPETIASAVESM